MTAIITNFLIHKKIMIGSHKVVRSIKHLRKINTPNLHKTFQKIKAEENGSQSYMRLALIVINKPDRYYKNNNKRKLQVDIPNEYYRKS